MFWTGGYDFGPSSLVRLLEADDSPALETLLREDELVQECKGINPRLVAYFNSQERVARLLRYALSNIEELTEELGDVATARRFLSVSCEVLCSDIPGLAELISGGGEGGAAGPTANGGEGGESPPAPATLPTPSLLSTLFAFLDRPTPLPRPAVNHFARISHAIVTRCRDQAYQFLEGHRDVFTRIFRHVDAYPVFELLIFFMRKETELEQQGLPERCPWFPDLELTLGFARVLARVPDQSYSWLLEAHQNAVAGIRVLISELLPSFEMCVDTDDESEGLSLRPVGGTSAFGAIPEDPAAACYSLLPYTFGAQPLTPPVTILRQLNQAELVHSLLYFGLYGTDLTPVTGEVIHIFVSLLELMVCPTYLPVSVGHLPLLVRELLLHLGTISELLKLSGSSPQLSLAYQLPWSGQRGAEAQAPIIERAISRRAAIRAGVPAAPGEPGVDGAARSEENTAGGDSDSDGDGSGDGSGGGAGGVAGDGPGEAKAGGSGAGPAQVDPFNASTQGDRAGDVGSDDALGIVDPFAPGAGGKQHGTSADSSGSSSDMVGRARTGPARIMMALPATALTPEQVRGELATVGDAPPVLGTFRLELVRLLRALLATNYAFVAESVAKTTLLQQVLGLLAAYPWHTLLHNTVFQVLRTVLHHELMYVDGIRSAEGACAPGTAAATPPGQGKDAVQEFTAQDAPVSDVVRQAGALRRSYLELLLPHSTQFSPSTLTGGQPLAASPLVWQLFSECALPAWLMQQWHKGARQAAPGKAGAHLRRGYMGHLTQLAVLVGSIGAVSPRIGELLTATEGWQGFLDTCIQPAYENYSQWLGGEPPGETDASSGEMPAVQVWRTPDTPDDIDQQEDTDL